MNPLYTSHRNDERQGGEAPNEPHLALQTGAIGDPTGLLAIPKGSHLFTIENPRRADTITEYILEKVVYENHVLKELRLIAYTKNAKSTRRLRLVASWEGEYKSGLNNPDEQ